MQAFFGLFRPLRSEALKGGYGVIFPDAPGAISQGHDLNEALDMAVEALSIILGCGRKGRDYSDPSPYEAILAQAEPGDLVFPIAPDARVVADNRPKTRISIMLPGSQLESIAEITEGTPGLDRSKFVAQAIDYYLAAKYPAAERGKAPAAAPAQ